MYKHFISCITILIVVSCGELQAQRLADIIALDICDCLSGHPPPVSEQDLQDCYLKVTKPYVVTAAQPEAYGDEMQQAVLLVNSNCNLSGKQQGPACNMAYSLSHDIKADKLFHKGNKAFAAQHYKLAAQFYEQALIIDQGFIKALDRKALAYRHLGNFKEAMQAYEKSIALYPNGHMARLGLAYLFSIRNDKEKASALYLQLIAECPEYAEGYYGQGRVLVLQQQYAIALPFVLKAHKLYELQKSPSSKSTDKLLSQMLAEMQKRGEEEAFYAMLLESGLNIQWEAQAD